MKYSLAAGIEKRPLGINVERADTFWLRLKGLLGRSHLAPQEGLWIIPCRDIHTFFMKFSIDCIFLDEKLRVLELRKAVRPGRVVGPVWKARSVLELSEGAIEHCQLKLGDQLHVGT